MRPRGIGEGKSAVENVRLLEPVALGSRAASNRVLFGPHETNLGRGRSLSDRHVAYYRRRASGGCGTIVVETASVHPSDWPYERAPLAAQSLEGWAAVAAAVHAEGSLALASLGHTGGQGSSAYSQSALWGPSRFPDPATRELPQQMEEEEIAELVDGFGQAAAGAVEAGLDGVEVNAGQSSLLRQFLSGITNTRDDRYGGDRVALLVRVLATVREALGPGPVLGIRLACDELAPWAGITPEWSVEAAPGLARWIDYVVAVRAPVFDLAGTRPDGHTEPGFAVPLARGLRSVLPPAVAVVTQGSMVSADAAEDVVANGDADLVEMTRAQIADPDMVKKLAQGQPETVRPCVLCNQRCTVRDARNPIVSCIAEPSSGYESEDPDWVTPAARPLEILVVGAGPAGLEAGRIAAIRGHRVRVVDRDQRPGGRLRTASHGHARGRLLLLVEWLVRECSRLGVELELGREVTARQVAEHEARGGRAILCTGSAPGPDRYVDDGTVLRLTAADLLASVEEDTFSRLPPGPVVVDDPVGDAVAVSIAELLAAAGRTVTLVTCDLVVGTQLSRTGDLAPANTRLARAGVHLQKRSVVSGVSGSKVTVEDRYAGTKTTLDAALLVDGVHRLPDHSLSSALGAPPLPELRPFAGDAVAPRTVYEAILEGRRAVDGLERAR